MQVLYCMIWIKTSLICHLIFSICPSRCTFYPFPCCFLPQEADLHGSSPMSSSFQLVWPIGSPKRSKWEWHHHTYSLSCFPVGSPWAAWVTGWKVTAPIKAAHTLASSLLLGFCILLPLIFQTLGLVHSKLVPSVSLVVLSYLGNL